MTRKRNLPFLEDQNHKVKQEVDVAMLRIIVIAQRGYLLTVPGVIYLVLIYLDVMKIMMMQHYSGPAWF